MKKIYTAVFRNWHTPYAWFGRDSGLVTEGLRRIGVESRLVILDTPGMDTDERFLPASREQFVDPGFWRSHELDAVVLQGGGDVGIEPVSLAIKKSGTKLLLRLDTDGVVAPQVDPYLYLYTLWWWLAFNRKHPAAIRALGKTFLKSVFPGKFGPGRIVRRLQLGDSLLVESRIAIARLQRLLCAFGAKETSEKLVYSPIPVADEWNYDSSVPKENLIVSVARWNDTQKDAPKLIKTLGRLLPQHASYRAVIIGNAPDTLRSLVGRHAPESAARITITGRLPHLDIPRYEQRAKIFICSSRAESMNISSAEALCCGCSVVGPAEIGSMHEYSSAQSGTMSWTRRTNDFADAVSAEIFSWKRGQRDPSAISSYFRSFLDCKAHARQILALLRCN